MDVNYLEDIPSSWGTDSAWPSQDRERPSAVLRPERQTHREGERGNEGGHRQSERGREGRTDRQTEGGREDRRTEGERGRTHRQRERGKERGQKDRHRERGKTDGDFQSRSGLQQ